MRPNPRLERDAIFNQMDIQTGRELNEDEVRRINFIVKSRAYHFVAAAEEEWLYPERHLAKKVKWGKVAQNYLLFPDPRELHHGGEIIIGYESGATLSRDAYGRAPLDPDYGKDTLPPAGKDPLEQLKGEFAQLFGRKRRGHGWDEPEEDSESLHEHHLSKAKRTPSREPNTTGAVKRTRRRRKRRGRR